MKSIKTVILSLVFAFSIGSALAQIPPSGTPGSTPQNVPLDGGALLLAAAGTVYGYKKHKERKKIASQSASFQYGGGKIV